MPHVTACDTCAQASWPPLCICGVPEISYGHAV